MKLVSFFTLMFLVTTGSVFGGPSVGGGGDVVILPNDTVVLADPFIDSGAQQPNNMPPLRALNPRILQAINLYQKAGNKMINQLSVNGKSEIAALLSELAIRKNDLRFYGVRNVEELNNFCAPGGRKIYKLPNGAQVQQVACTAGSETFIVEPLFVQLSLRDQALLLIHERLTTLRDKFGGKNYSAIARFTTGLDVFLNLYSEQAKKVYRILSVDEQKKLTEFYIATEEIERRNEEVGENSFQWIAHTNGGGRLHASANVDPTAFISLEVTISNGSEIKAGAKVLSINNRYGFPLFLGEKTVLENVTIEPMKISTKASITLLDGAVLSNVKLNFLTSNSTFSENSTVKNSTIDTGYIFLGLNSSITNSIIDTTSLVREFKADSLFIGNNVEFKEASLDKAGELKVADGEKLIGQKVVAESNNFFPAGVKLKPIDTLWTLQNFECYSSNPSPKEMKVELLNAANDGAVITGKIKSGGKVSIFKPERRYEHSNFKIKLTYKNFVANTDKNLLDLDSDGHFIALGFSKEGLIVELNNIDQCLTRNIYEQASHSAFVYPISGGNYKFAIKPQIQE